MHLSSNAHEISYGLVGGLIIGLSSTFYLYSTGKISGMSGIVSSVFTSDVQDACYLGGLVLSGVILKDVAPSAFGPHHASHSTLTAEGAALAGLLVGFGSSLGSGCTSGHGVCGLGRRSPRSLVAVMTFMATGAASAAYFRGHPLIFHASSRASSITLVPVIIAGTTSVLLFTVLPWAIDRFLGMAKQSSHQPTASVSLEKQLPNYAFAFVSALIFGAGLGVSGMCNPDKVSGFLDFTNPVKGFDPSLAGVMGGAVLLNLFTFSHFAAKNPQKVCMGPVGKNLEIDWRLLAGSALFGMGWGLGGVCPGPALVSLGAGRSSTLAFLPWMIAGMALHKGLGRKMVSDEVRAK